MKIFLLLLLYHGQITLMKHDSNIASADLLSNVDVPSEFKISIGQDHQENISRKNEEITLKNPVRALRFQQSSDRKTKLNKFLTKKHRKSNKINRFLTKYAKSKTSKNRRGLNTAIKRLIIKGLMKSTGFNVNPKRVVEDAIADSKDMVAPDPDAPPPTQNPIFNKEVINEGPQIIPVPIKKYKKTKTRVRHVFVDSLPSYGGFGGPWPDPGVLGVLGYMPVFSQKYVGDQESEEQKFVQHDPNVII